jgi:hypothetical protein
MLWRPWNLPKPWRLPERGPQRACPCSDHGGAPKSYKIPSVHVIFIPAANATIQTEGLNQQMPILKLS